MGRSLPARVIALAALALAALVLLAGCGRHGERASDCAVRGIDVSRHQNEIDWPSVSRAGIAFAWIKATEGGDHLDPRFERNWRLSAAAGIARGAYHFVYWCRLPEDQAAWFLANVAPDPDALPPVLDVEWNPQSRSCPQHKSKAEALATMAMILAAMEKAYGKTPIIYAPADFFQEIMQGELEAYPLWVRSLGQPPVYYGERRWLVWQHSETGLVPGITGSVDLDCFQGSRSDWRAWFAGMRRGT